MPHSLGTRGLKRLARAVKRLDPEGRFVDLDVDAGVVKYGPEIRTHVGISSFTGEEEPTRAFIVAWLCTDGGYLPANIELEKPYSVGRPKAGARLDILVNHADGKPYALIEVKAPGEYDAEADKYIKGQLFDIAPHETDCSVLSYATVEANGDITVHALSIAATPGLRFEDWAASRAAAIEIPKNYGEPTHVHLERDGQRDLRMQVPAQVLDSLRKRLHDVLWRGATPDNLVYEYVVKLFLAKIYDEKTTGAAERYRFQIFYTGQERETPRQTFARINELYIEAYARYVASSPRDRPEPLDRRSFSPEQIAFVVELLQGVALTAARSGGDLLGGFFEAITREGFKQSKGLFFTHLNLAVFLLEAAGVEDLVSSRLHSNELYSERLPYVIDPACGSGTFLLAAMRLITDFVTNHRRTLATNPDVKEFLDEKFPSSHPNAWANDFLYGLDTSALLAMSTKVNMVLHRDGNTHIYHADGLAPLAKYAAPRLKGTPHDDPDSYSRLVAESFDLVVSNPPFSITLPPETSQSLSDSFELAGDRNSENLFLERWYQLLKPGGRLAVVLPESTFSTKENFAVRQFLLDHFDIRAIVSLPRHAFEPWTPTRTCLLFAKKKCREDEAAWRTKREEASSATKVAKSAAQRSARRLRKEIGANGRHRPDATLVKKLNDALQELSLPTLAGSARALGSSLDSVLEQLKGVDPNVAGLKTAIEELGRDYTAVTVSSIGYKRTRRTEYNRLNELFKAVAEHPDAQGETLAERVPNLNLGPTNWRVDVDDANPSDVLSLLAMRDIWH